MAAKSLIRRVVAIYDRDAAKKMERDFEASMRAAGVKSGGAFLKELRAAFEQRMAKLREDLAKGLIDQRAFKAQADSAAKAFNTVLVKGMEQARQAGTLTNAEYLKLSRQFKRTGDEGVSTWDRIKGSVARAGAAVAVFFGIRSLTTFFAGTVRSAIEAEDSIGQLDVALGTLGSTYSEVRDEVERTLNSIQRTTRFSDEDARVALANLVTITGDYQKSLSLLDITSQIAEKRHVTMAVASETAGKAALGLTRGMVDLGVKTGQTGDIVKIISGNLGNLAQDSSRTGRNLAIINNLWSEFKERIGLAIIGADKFGTGTEQTAEALVKAADAVDRNAKSIGALVNVLIRATAWLGSFVGALGKVWAFSEKMDAKGERFWKRLFGGGTPDVPTTPPIVVSTPPKPPGKRPPVITGDGKGGVKIVAPDGISDEQRTLNDRLSRGDFARPGVISTPGRTDTGLAGPFSDPVAIGDMSEDAAQRFSSPWVDALNTVKDEIDASQGFFSELGQAWAEGGAKGVAVWAKAKVKENIAAAIEEGAKALGSLALLNPAAAAVHAKAAAGHVAAAAAWGVASSVAGGGGGGGAPSSGAGVGQSGGGLRPRGAEVSIYFDGPDIFNPRLQKQLNATLVEVRERMGPNTKVTVKKS